MNAESLIKSRIAGFIVSLMLQESGYTIIPYGSDYILERLIQAGITKHSKVSKILLNMPTFVIVNKNKEPIFLKIRFRGKNKSGRNIDWGNRQINQYWFNAHMVVVTNEKPYFYLVKGESTVPLIKSVFNINKKTHDKFVRLVEKFLLS